MPGSAPNGSSDTVPKAPVLTFPTMYGRNQEKSAATSKSAVQSNPSRSHTHVNSNHNKGITGGQHAVAAPNTARTHSTPKPAIPINDWIAANRSLMPKGDGVVEFQKLTNVPIEKRIAMLDGPFLDIKCGAQVFKFPVRLMLMICPNARREYNEHILGGRDIDELVVRGVQRLDKFLNDSLSSPRPFRLRSSGDNAAGFSLDLDTIIAAEIMGISQLVGPLRGYWWRWFMADPIEDIGSDFLEVLEKRISASFKSSIIEMIVQTQARRYARGEMREPGRAMFRSSIIHLPKMWKQFYVNLKAERAKLYQS